MALRQVRDLCTDVKTYPEHVETDPSTAEYIHDNGFYIQLCIGWPGRYLKSATRARCSWNPCTGGRTAEGAGRSTDGRADCQGTGDQPRHLRRVAPISSTSGWKGLDSAESDGRTDYWGVFLDGSFAKGSTEGIAKLSGKPFSKGAGGTGYIHSDRAIFQCGSPAGQDCPRYLQEGKERGSFCVQGQNVEVDKRSRMAYWIRFSI